MGERTTAQTWSVVCILLPILGIVANAVSLPGCQAVAPQQNILGKVRAAQIPVPLQPFGLSYATHGDVAYVALDFGITRNNSNSSLGILDTSILPPTLVDQIVLPSARVNSSEALGLTVTKDSRHIFIAGGEGAFIVDARRAIESDPNAVVGVLNGTAGKQTTGNNAIEVTLSRDQRYAFVSQEYGAVVGETVGNIDVFKLDRPTSNGTVFSEHIGHLDLGYAVVGTALSPDGRLLYAVSETTTSNDTTPGTLSVIDVETLKTQPSAAQRFNVSAACGPVRIIVSCDGSTVWVTARESNHLLAFNATKLALNISDDALIASVQVGTSPVGLIFARNETRILTADSNRFGNTNTSNATTGISVIDVQAVLSGRSQAAIGRIPTGIFPREFASSPDGETVLVSEFGSGEVQVIDVSTLP